VVEVLERDLKIKVVWALAAEMWFTYRKLRIDNPVPNGGTLLSGNYDAAL
jgi:maleate cis-trans isomerase